MGYTTDFMGRFELNKPLDEETKTYLTKFATTRRMARRLPPEYGIEGEFYVDGKDDIFNSHKDETIINVNEPPRTQPSLYCQWIPSHCGKYIEWDEGEKFYYYVEWLRYIQESLLKPRGYRLVGGKVNWRGEDFNDMGTITITKDGTIKVKELNYETI